LHLVRHGQKNEFLAIINDISKRKDVEKERMHFHHLMQYVIEHNQSAVAIHDKNLNYIYVSQRYLHDYQITEPNIIGKNHYDVFPDLPQNWRDVHQRALNGEIVSADNDPYYRSDGRVDWTRWECRPWYDSDGSIGGIIVYTEVINEQKKREQQIQQLNTQLEQLIEAIQELSSAQSLVGVEEKVLRASRELTGSDGATFIYRDDDRCYYGNESAIEPLWKGSRFPLDQCISGWSMMHQEPALVADIFADERIPIESYRSTFVKSLVIVPIHVENPIGAIGNYWKEKHEASPIEIRLIQTLADAASRAVENIRLRENLERNIQEKTSELNKRVEELERFYSATIEREFRIKELRDEIDRLKGRT
ncbi:MAG TPA: PAS domain-containing protein, partial [Prolixibacteraceae bacterium]|nr:PAS domain-containing protein [Prolixibacteraceae bacterium]